MKQGIKQFSRFSSCPGLTKPGISMCSSQGAAGYTGFKKSLEINISNAQLRKSETPFMRPVFKWLESDWLPFVDWSTESTGLQSPL